MKNNCNKCGQEINLFCGFVDYENDFILCLDCVDEKCEKEVREATILFYLVIVSASVFFAIAFAKSIYLK